MAKKQTYEKTKDGLIKILLLDLFANIKFSSIPAEYILDQAKLFCKILGPAKVFGEKSESS